MVIRARNRDRTMNEMPNNNLCMAIRMSSHTRGSTIRNTLSNANHKAYLNIEMVLV